MRREEKLVNASQPENNPTKQAERAFTYSYQLLVSFLVSAVLHGWEKTDKQGGAFSRESEICQRRGQKKTSWQVPIHRTGAAVLAKFSLGICYGSRKCLNGIALSSILINILCLNILIHPDIEYFF